MKAVIMAGGEGSRLRPLTCDLPKPMTRLCGRPMLEYILELLSNHGVTDAILTLRYLPDIIKDHFENGSFAGIKLRFSEEDTPLGTAGSVKNAVDFDEDFIIISGDALTDFDLSAAVEFHYQNNADATLIIKKIRDPREYGLVRIDSAGKVTGFIEKPDYSQADSEYANTGIYILSPKALSMIPKDNQYDFASDLFPQMLKANMPVYAFKADGYWCDIGDIATYISCQKDIMAGKVKCKTYPSQREYPSTVKIHYPVFIGENVTLCSGCEIGPNTVLDEGCQVGANAQVIGSVMLEDSWVGEKAKITGALVCAGASVKRRAQVFEQGVIGEKSIVGEGAQVKPCVKVWPEKIVDDREVLRSNLKYGNGMRESFETDGISGETGVEITPEFCASLGAACASLKSIKKISVACNDSKAAKALKSAFVSGALSTGAEVWDFGATFRSMNHFSQTFSGIKLSIYFMSGAGTMIFMTNSGGLPIDRGMERELQSIMRQSNFKRCAWSEVKESIDMSGIALIYRQELLSMAPEGLNGMKANVISSDERAGAMLSSTLQKLGCIESDSTVFHLESSGTSLAITDSICGFIGSEQVLALSMLPLLEAGQTISVPYNAPFAYDVLAEICGGKVVRYLDTPADRSDSSARSIACNQMFIRDGLMSAIRILAYMKKTGSTIADLYARLPDFAVEERKIDISCSPGMAIEELKKSYSESSQAEQGMVIRFENGSARVVPDKKGSKLKVLVESFNMEAAKEICGKLEEGIVNTLDSRSKN